MGKTYPCKHCSHEITAPEGVAIEIEIGDEAVLYCEICHYLTYFENGEAVECSLPRAAMRWEGNTDYMRIV